MGTFAVELQFLYAVYYLFQRFKLINNSLSKLSMEDVEQIPSKIFYSRSPVEGTYDFLNFFCRFDLLFLVH